MSSIILVVHLGSGHIHWSRSLTQCALLEWQCRWDGSPQGHGLGFFGSICSLNISNLFLNAAFCSLFSTVSKGRHPKSIPQGFFFFFFCVEVPHTALITLLHLSPSPLLILFPGSLPNTWAWLLPEATLVFLQGAFPQLLLQTTH